jgi:hypothetical protein
MTGLGGLGGSMAGGNCQVELRLFGCCKKVLVDRIGEFSSDGALVYIDGGVLQ